MALSPRLPSQRSFRAPAPSPATAAAQPSAAEVPVIFQECPNCKQQVLGSNFALHEAHCTRHRKACAHCSLLLPKAEVDQHVAEQLGSFALLAAAIERGDVARVQAALDHDAHKVVASWRDGRGGSVLHLAAAAARDRWDMQALVETLLRHGAAVDLADSHGWTALHAAARAGAAVAVGALLANGANVHARDALGTTPIEVSAGDEVRLALLGAGAELPGTIGSSRHSSGAASAMSSHHSSRGQSRESARTAGIEPRPPDGPSRVGRPPSRARGADPGAAGAISDISDLATDFSRCVRTPADVPSLEGTHERAGSTREAEVARGPLSSSRHAQRLRAQVHAEGPSQ